MRLVVPCGWTQAIRGGGGAGPWETPASFARIDAAGWVLANSISAKMAAAVSGMAAQSPQKAVSALSGLCGCAGMPAQCKSDAAAILEGAAVAAHPALMPGNKPDGDQRQQQELHNGSGRDVRHALSPGSRPQNGSQAGHIAPPGVTIQAAIAIIIRFSVSDTKPSGTLVAPPTQAHFNSRRSM